MGLYRNRSQEASSPSIQGLGPGDRLLIHPALGNKRSVRLTTREVTIRDGKHCSWGPGQLTLPRLDPQESFALLLHLEGDGPPLYRITTQCQIPFSLGPVLAYDALLGHGDTITLGANKLTFLREQEVQKRPNILEIDNFERVSKSPLGVFIEGETGTGKSHLARDLHEYSGRTRPFVHLNLASFSEGVLESELFGHRRGAFTGALYDKKGALGLAHGGTLFLDEIDSLSPGLQTKLLLFFDTGLVRPVGGTREEKVEAKIIVSSGRDLLKLSSQGHFRRDFYYRITSGHKIHLKPLREKRHKICEILEAFEGENGITLSRELKGFYVDYPWPGNLRQLYSHLELKKTLSPGKYWSRDACDLELKVEGPDLAHGGPADILPLRSLKRRYVGQVFHQCSRSVSKTAHLLDIAPNTVKNILREEGGAIFS